MRGHDALITMRLAGKVPAHGVEIETGEDPSRWPEIWVAERMSSAYLSILPTESLTRADFRAVAGLLVRVEGVDSQRVAAVAEKAKKSGAARVIATVYRRRGEELETVSVSDTEGILKWPE